jgi:hypothetical protein
MSVVVLPGLAPGLAILTAVQVAVPEPDPLSLPAPTGRFAILLVSAL